MLKNERKVVCSNLSNTVCSNDYIVDNVSGDDYLDTTEFKTIKKLLSEDNLEYMTDYLRDLLKVSKKNNPNCFALHLYDVTEFEEYLTLRDMRSISKNADMPQYIKFIYDNDPLYEVIKEWDEAFSLDGNLCDNPSKTKQIILQKARMKGRK